MKLRRAAFLLLYVGSPCIGFADSGAFLHVLGIAQDGGYPQAGCYQPHCMRAWEHPQHRRKATSIAVIDETQGRKYVFDATPDFREQLYELHKVASDEHFEFGGVFLTHAHMGHYTGLMHVGHEAAGMKGLPVFAMPRMREYLSTSGPWSQLVSYGNISLVALSNNKKVRLADSLTVTPFRVPHREEYSEVVGFQIDGPNRSALFIPDIDKWERWDRDIVALVRQTDYALLDATFFADGEIPGRPMDQIPHPFVEESMSLFGRLTPEEKSRVIFIHINHTNPLLIEGSAERQRVLEAGYRIAHEGMRLVL